VAPSDGATSEKDKERRLPDVFRDAWTQALSAVSNAEEEAQRALARVWSPEEVRKNAQAFAEKLVGQRKEVEKSIDAGVKRTLARSKLPRREEVEALRARATALSARVNALAQKRRSSR
jgi:polyhydroxyalkanoate synthesis regulator phasin